MAIIETRADDFDGSTPAETMTFSVAGKEYAIDLNEEHRKELEDVLAEMEEKLRRFTAAARPLGRATRKTRTASSSNASGETAKVRAWAQENGYEVKDRGRISAEIMEAYRNRSRKG
ncbi:Lsr2 family protein [Micrococcus sp.]|uniref:histone-like nucleoid-structuring protein Lsr2 n=1 Tax=Micrococcus sp. TaxID=1271 RepID=UPI002A91F083|nr:Lsr2 family protein [Micrococcus sp.]MDY6055082.1 Lsr2 family protein [Micrococcus sp.]